MKTKESVFLCNQNTFTSGVYNYWAPGRLTFVRWLLIFSPYLLQLILSHIEKYVSFQMNSA